MKHCAKKLLGLAFALALCLAVGGTALAQTPEYADVPAALPEQEMLAYEPYAAPAAEGMNTVTGDGYTVTIPTTVEVKSTTDTGTLEVKGELEVTAVMKQWRTLSIKIEPQTPTSGAWTLKYNGNASAGTTLPQVEYNLPELDMSLDEWGNPNYEWVYDDSHKQLDFLTQILGGPENLSQTKTITAKLAVTVPHPEQATMSGTYSDILTFRITPDKTCITYNINVYEQELKITNTGTHVEAVDMVDTDGKVIGNPTPKLTKTFEYPMDNGTPYQWTYSSNDPEDDKLRWEELPTVTMNTAQDKADGKVDAKKNVTINLNLKRKWYWLDVNGATDYNGESANGNQGGRISGYVDMQVSADDGATWSDWFRYNDGDDYWQQLPYGIHFKLGLHHVKNGYVYDMGTGGGVRIIANKEEKYTAAGETVNGSTYYVYTGEMTGEPTDTVDGGKIRYCYVPCYKKGLTYIANDGIGGKEDVNEDNPPRTNVPYNTTDTLKAPAQLGIYAPAGKSFAGWSTSADYPTTGELYKPGYDVSKITWGKYTDTSKRPKLDGKIDDEKRELYAIWGYDITVQFEDEKGYTEDGTSTPVLGGTMDGCSFILKGQVVADGADWTLDLTNSTVKEKIGEASEKAKSDTWIKDALDNETATGDELAEKIWKIGSHTEGSHTFDFTKECTISAAKLESGTRTLTIQRRRYLLSVISADADTDEVNGIATNPLTTQYGTFTVTVNGVGKVYSTSFYQCGLNYGAKYEINDVTAKSGYNPNGYMVFKLSLKKGTMPEQDGYQAGAAIPKSKGESYSGFMTAKRSNIHYYTNGGNSSTDIYTGDPVRIGFMNMVSSSKPGSTTPMPGPSLAPAKKTLTLRYHANFDPTEELALDLDPDPLLEDMDDTFGFDPDPLPEDVDDTLEEAVKTVSYRPGEDVVLRNCMFKRGGYVFAGWNTEPDGTGKGYEVDGVPRTDWAAGDTVDLYAQWKKPEHMKPVVDDEPFVPTDPDTPPEWVDDVFGVDPAAPPEDADTAFGVDPAQPEGLDDAFGVDPDPQPEALDDAFGVDPAAQPEELDDAFGVDPDPMPDELDAAFSVDPDPQPEELDDAFSV